MKRIALVDSVRGGHHATYLKLYAQVALSLGLEVMVFCPDPEEMRALLQADPQPRTGDVRCFALDEPAQSSFPVRLLRPALDGFRLWLGAARAIERAHLETGLLPELVFFLWLDSYATHLQSRHLIDAVFPHQWSGLLFHPYHLRLPLSFPALRRGPLDLDEAFKSRRCRAVGVLDEGVAPKLQRRLADKAVIVFPDLADQSPPDADYPLAKQIAARAAGRKVVSLLGSLEKRKGVLALLEVAQSPAGRDWFFVIAGALSEQSFAPDELRKLRGIAADPPENCLLHWQFIPGESRFNALVAASDLLFAAYDNFLHSSNMLIKAALFRKPVIVSGGHCMAERVDAYRLGRTIEYGNSGQCLQAIGELLGSGGRGAGEPDHDGYLAAHSKEQLAWALQRVVDCYRQGEHAAPADFKRLQGNSEREA